MSIDAPDEVVEGGDFTASVDISYVEKFAAAEFVVTFDSSVLEVTDVTNVELDGNSIHVDGYTTPWEGDADKIKVLVSWPPLYPGVSGEGFLAEIHFHVIGTSCQTSPIELSEGLIADQEAMPIEATWLGDSVRVFTLGDADGDGDVDVFDLVYVKRIIMGLDPPTPGADANLDGTVNVLDLVKIKRIILGIDP